MRIAIVSDIHGNLTAFEAVVADLKRTSPDLILHGGRFVPRGIESGAGCRSSSGSRMGWRGGQHR
jgi:Icc-related predicted phosphoesterase